ncbi:MAG TPA: ABC transporter permease [Opitutaceae bacterium]|nr:ABC transporter permease [Opitutaceae bacterium]
MNDLRYAIRQLRKSPGFTAVAVLTLAIGIGGCTAIFSVVSGLLLSPLPYPESARLMQIDEQAAPGALGGSCGGTFLEWQENNEHFDLMAAFHPVSHNLTGRGEPEQIQGWEVTPQFLSLFGLRPVLGRDFLPDDDAAGANHRVIIASDAFWREHLGSDPNAVGEFIQFDGDGYEVIGVLEPDALIFPGVEFLAPTGMLSAQHKQDRNYTYVTTTLARLKPGSTPEAAATQLTTVKQRNNEFYPERKKAWTVAVGGLQERMFGGARQSLGLLMGSVAVVLLIACANIANLLLARNTSRSAEIALRATLGASKGRLFRQLLTESLVLAVIGGAAGIFVATLAIDPLTTFAGVNRFERIEFGVDGRVLAFALGASVLTGVLFGALPAWRALRADMFGAIKEGGRSGTSGSRKHLQGVLIVAETGLTVVLLVIAGLLMRSFANVAGESVGFERHGALAFRIAQSGDTAQTIEKRTQFTDRILAELEQIPGVKAAGMISAMPLNGRNYYGDSIHRSDQPVTDANITAGFDGVSPGFFKAMGIPLRRGRNLTAADNRADAPKVMLVNEALVARFFPDGEDPLGGRIHFKGNDWEIVGVVGDVRRFNPAAPPPMQVYLAQVHFPWSTHYVVRTDLPPASLASQVRQAVQNVNPDQPISDLRTLDDLFRERMSFRRMMLTLLSLFAAIALLLACIGLYGVMAYSVAQRTRELGIRMALGAGRGGLLRLVLGQGLRLLVIGVVIGAIGAAAAAPVLESQLYNVGRFDPFVFLGVSLTLVAVGALACWLPARRATRINPIEALRAE